MKTKTAPRAESILDFGFIRSPKLQINVKVAQHITIKTYVSVVFQDCLLPPNQLM